MTCAIESKGPPITIDEKRFYVPAIIKDTCPKCGAAYERDLNEQYLSYPPCNVPFNLTMDCYAEVDGKPCGAEWEIPVRLDVQVSLVLLTGSRE